MPRIPLLTLTALLLLSVGCAVVSPETLPALQSTARTPSVAFFDCYLKGSR